jgi:4-carboxymuconolactone decarboxylase
VGRAVGLTDDELAALATGSFSSPDVAEQTAYELCLRLLEGRSRLTDDDYAGLTRVLGTTTLTELVVLVGYYRTLAQLLDVYDVAAPGPQG